MRNNPDKVFVPAFMQCVANEFTRSTWSYSSIKSSHNQEHKATLIKMITCYYMKIRMQHERHFLIDVDAYIRQTHTKIRINNKISHWTISIFFNFSLLHQPVLYDTIILMIDITLPIIQFFLSHVRVNILRTTFSLYCKYMVLRNGIYL